MACIRIPKVWELPQNQVTPQQVFINRRAFLRTMGFTGMGLLAGCSPQSKTGTGNGPLYDTERYADLYPAQRNPAYTVDRAITSETAAGTYNKFYEFTTDKERVGQLVHQFKTHPWQVEVKGLVHKPKVYDIDDLIRRFPLEERLYRFRCVEAWAMTVPWTGFTLKALIDAVQPTAAAKYVRLVTFLNPEQAPGQKTQSWYPWPYYEGLTMAEATNELSFMATGIYGHPLPKQHGAPLRLVVPWKYGFKSIKSVIRIEFTDKQPPTFWNDLVPREYDFVANVNPRVPHPRWSQATERLVGTDERVPTRSYNGYGESVAHLYRKA